MRTSTAFVAMAGLVATVTAYPGNLASKSACKDLKVGTPIGGTMGFPAVTEATGAQCTVTNAPATYVAGTEYEITVESDNAGANVILYAEDGCMKAGSATGQKLASDGGVDMDDTKPNECMYRTTNKAVFKWTAPTQASGTTTFKALCGNIGAYVAIATAESKSPTGDTLSCGAASGTTGAGPLLADPYKSCEADKADFTRINTVSTMTICYTTDAKYMEDKYDARQPDSVLFRMSVTGKYGAIGLNSKFDMPGTEFFAVTYNEAQQRVRVATGSTVARTGTSLRESIKLGFSKASGKKGDPTMAAEWIATAADLGLPANTKLADALKTSTLIFATAPGAVGDVGKHSFDGKGGGSCSGAKDAACTLKVAYPATTGNLVHGSLMILAWIILSPTGTLIARYLKQLGATWYFSHRNLQATAIVTTILGLIIIGASGVKMGDLEGDSKAHAQYGFVVIALCIVQGLLGAFRNQISAHTGNDGTDHGPRRWLFNWLHKANGAFLFGAGIFTVHAGLTVFPEGWVADPAPALMTAWAIIIVVLGVIVEGLHMTLTEGYIPIWTDTSSDAGKAESATEKKIRAILMSLAIAFTIGTGIALVVIVADTDNTGEFKKFNA